MCGRSVCQFGSLGLDHVDVDADAAQQLGQPDTKVTFKEVQGSLRGNPDRQGLHRDQVISGHCVRDCRTVSPTSKVLKATSRERRTVVLRTGAKVALEVPSSLIRGGEGAQPVSH